MKNIHVLQTDKKTRLFTSDSVLILTGYPATTFKTGKNIYITSNEEITEGDWFLGLQNQISKATSKDIYGGYELKIILTTDQNLIKSGVQAIDDEFLEWFVQNPSCKEVEVEDYNSYGVDNWKYLITIPKEETKLKNICIKCGVDLYATEGRFECQKHPKECKGIILPEETLQEWADKEKEKVVSEYDIMPNIVYGENVGERIKIKAKILSKEEQKQHLIDMMKSDEELGLYEEPKQTDEKGKPMTYWGGLEKSKQEATPEEVAEYLGFVKGVKWQQEQDENKYSEEDMEQAFIAGVDKESYNGVNFDIWFEQFKKNKL